MHLQIFYETITISDRECCVRVNFSNSDRDLLKQTIELTLIS